MNTEALFSSEFDDWNSPECVLERVRMLGPIGLDPCSNPQSTVGARVEWRLDRGEDALRREWSGHGLVFCNPPYGGLVGAAFMRRMALFGALGVEIVALVPNRTETEWYQDNTRKVAVKCEWYGRLSHPRGQSMSNQTTLWDLSEKQPQEGAITGVAPFPSVVLYWGQQVETFSDIFTPCGAIWRSANSLKVFHVPSQYRTVNRETMMIERDLPIAPHFTLSAVECSTWNTRQPRTAKGR